MQKITNLNKNFLWLTIIIIAISFYSCVCSFSAISIYKYTILLPLGYVLCNILFFKVYRTVTVSSALVLGFMFLRYSITPIILYLDNYPMFGYHVLEDDAIALETTLILLYEMIVIFIALCTNKWHSKSKITDVLFLENVDERANFKQLNIIICVFLLLTFSIILLYPSLLDNYVNVMQNELDIVVNFSETDNIVLPRGLKFFSAIFMEASRFILIQFIIYFLHSHHTKKTASICWFLSLTIIVFNSFIANGRLMLGMMMTVVFACQVYRLYPQFRKRLYIIGLLFGFIFLIAIFVFYLGRSIAIYSLSSALQAYSNGFHEAYQARMAYDVADLTFFEKVEMLFWGDGISKIVIVSSFFHPLLNTSDIYNYYMYGINFNGGKVVPLVSQESYYFSSLLGPIITGYYIRFMQYFEYKSNIGQGNISLYLFLSIIFAITPFMFNISISIHAITTVVLPLFVFSFLNRISFRFSNSRISYKNN